MNFETNKEKYKDGIKALVTEADNDLIPPISGRSGTRQTNLKVSKGTGIDQYMESLMEQDFIIAVENEEVLGFLSYISDQKFCEEKDFPLPCLYVSTIIVSKKSRGKGVGSRLYEHLFSKHPDKNITTRTWDDRRPGAKVNVHTSIIVGKYHFYEYKRIIDDRGENIDTVYFHRKPTEKVH